MKPFIFTLVLLSVIFSAKSQNKLPLNGRIGLGTSSPKALLDVNGNALFRDTVRFSKQLRLPFLNDTNVQSYRPLSITPEGTIGHFTAIRNDSIHAAKRLRIGSNSMYMEEGTNGENYFYATDHPLEINPSMSGVTLQNTFINPDGGSLIVGYPTDDTAITTATLSAQTLAGSSICGKANTGVAICAEVNNTSGVLFRGSHIGVNQETFEIDAYGKIWSWGGFEIGQNAKGGRIVDPDHTSLNYIDHDIASNYEHTLHINSYGSPSSSYRMVRLNLASTQGKFFEAVTTSGTTETERFSIEASGKVVATEQLIRPTSFHTLAFSIEDVNNDAVLKIFKNGHVYAPEIHVDDPVDFPDYVFEQDYELMDLKKLRKYIEREGHLPEVPTTSEVAENGLAIGEMNVLLLKKVEELTLYILELEERMNEYELQNNK